MIVIWGFFLVAKIHVYKFQDYSRVVPPVTKLLAVALILLTGLGYYYIIKMDSTSPAKTQTIEETNTREIY